MLLSIDTAIGSSVALVDPVSGETLGAAAVTDTMRHAEVIGELIAEVLTSAGRRASDVTGVVSGIGPGPFTGLRIGMAAARAFAFGAHAPLHPIVSHDGIARQWYAAGHRGPLRVVTDARRREVYWSAYTGLDAAGVPVRVSGPNLCVPADLPEDEAHRLDAVEVPAAELARVAEGLLRSGGTLPAGDPLYLRSPDVTPPAPGKRVTA